MDGRGRERFNTGECFLVYYKNGYRIDALASKKTSPSKLPQDFATRETANLSMASPKSIKKDASGKLNRKSKFWSDETVNMGSRGTGKKKRNKEKCVIF